MKQQEQYENQLRIWKGFESQFGTNYHFNILETREYIENKKKYNITPKSSNSLKAKASNLPVTMVEVGMEEEGYGFYAKFMLGRINDDEISNSYKGGFNSPLEAYSYILNKATEKNKVNR